MSARSLDVSWRSIAKVLIAVALVWAWLQLWQFIMVIGVAIVMAVALSPAVQKLEERGVPRWAGAAGFVLLLVALIGGILGGQLAGVLNALLALPIAAIYPTIERIWLRERLGGDTVDKHQRLSA